MGSFKGVVLAQVMDFFETGHMPSNISRSNIVLIPKIEEPVQVGDFRPISVCNVSILGCALSRAQSAFLPGREISENIILFREVLLLLHSFNQSWYRNEEFCLKVDLAKAFDKMDWDYIAGVHKISRVLHYS